MQIVPQLENYTKVMSDPATLNTERVELSRPEFEWETRGGSPSINEGPQILESEDHTHIVFSGSGSWSDFYNLGILTDRKDSDLLDPASWSKKEEPVFQSGNGVFGPGHASFTKSPDDSEDWIVYHAAKAEGSGWSRNVRMQPFTFDEEGNPEFGEPIAADESIPLPAGSEEKIYRITGEEMESEAAREEDLIRLTAGDSVQFKFDAPEDGTYTLYLYGENQQEVSLTGTIQEESPFKVFKAANDGSAESFGMTYTTVELESGSNTINLEVQSGDILLYHVDLRD
ncbi:family 43 glycosylhydrolase [Jeotgalibacillus proteolyticus]|uniref:family 43 glycosylhydrolase n=1 Tax=Jeotgalibacillus proteolyticus TaxID=2082395 RepID=UPI003CEFBC9A